MILELVALSILLSASYRYLRALKQARTGIAFDATEASHFDETTRTYNIFVESLYPSERAHLLVRLRARSFKNACDTYFEACEHYDPTRLMYRGRRLLQTADSVQKRGRR